MLLKGSLLVKTVGLFLLGLLTAGNITIDQDIPSEMKPGDEVLVTVDISKGDLTGFAKLQLDIPSGMTVTAVDKHGASFTFSKQKAKFIWMALPVQENFKVSYYLSLSPISSGVKEINGTFSYIEDNERKIYDLPTYSVELGESDLTALDDETILMNEPAIADLLPGETTAEVPEAESFSLPLLDAIQGPGGVVGERTIEKTSADEFVVSVKLTKKNIRGFGKLQETIPAGFIATEIESDDAIFTTQGQIVKFVWLNLPPKEELFVEYRMVANAMQEDEYKIDGQFGYLLNDETQKTTLASTPFKGSAPVVVKNDPEPTDEPDVVAANEPEQQSSPSEESAQVLDDAGSNTEASTEQSENEIIATPVGDIPQPELANSTPSTEVETPVTDAVSNVVSAETGITYKVQITAAHKDVGRAYFISRHNFHGDFGIERHEGWTKYLTGKYGQYNDAKARRNALVSAGHKFPGPFVTAYNEGQRISVQEALMISNQKWVQ